MGVRNYLLAALSIALSTSAWAQWQDESQSAVPDDPSHAHSGDFAVMLVVTADPDGFLKQWEQPDQPGYLPRVTTTSKLRRGETIVAFVVFAGCGADTSGDCNSTADFSLLKPDGSEYGKLATGELWRKKKPPPTHLQLGVGQLRVRIEPDDPLGTYTLKVAAHDLVAHKDVPLEMHFDVVAEAAATTVARVLPQSVSSPADLEVVLRDYYKGPDPDLIAGTIAELAREHVFEKEGAVAPVVTFLAYVFAANDTRLPEWRAAIEQQDGSTKRALRRAVELAADPSRIFVGAAPSADLNDARWGAFFATGDTAHIAALIGLLEHMDERRDMMLFLTAATAKWSLASNARQHPLVRTAVLTAKAQASPAVRGELEEVIALEPEDIRKATVMTLVAGKGIWK